jgi:Tfp pilus assembly protein PilO
MRALRTQSEWCARVQLIMGVSLVVLLGGFVAFVYRPSSQKLAALRDQADEQRRKLTSNRSQVQILPEVMLEVDRMQTRLERFDKKLPSQPDLGPFINDITEVSHQANLRKVQVEPGVPSRTDLYTEWPIALKFEGDFASVFAFLRRAEAMQRLTHVRGLKVKSSDNGKSGSVQVELSMNIYFSEG